MIKKLVSIAALILIITASGLAQDLVLKGGTVLTMTNGTIKNGTIVIRNGKITAIGRDVLIPAGIKVIDTSGKYIMPGIIDTHVHYALTGMSE